LGGELNAGCEIGPGHPKRFPQATYSTADLVHVLPKGATMLDRAVAFADNEHGNK